MGGHGEKSLFLFLFFFGCKCKSIFCIYGQRGQVICKGQWDEWTERKDGKKRMWKEEGGKGEREENKKESEK